MRVLNTANDGWQGQRVVCRILTVDPVMKRVDGKLTNGQAISMAVVVTPGPLFRWPRQGEFWVVEYQNTIWHLIYRYEDTYSSLPLSEIPDNTARIDAAAIKTTDNKDAVITQNSDAEVGHVLIWKTSSPGAWVPEFIDSTSIADGAIGTPQLANNAVTSQQLADGSITTQQLADGSVNTPKLANGSVTPAKHAIQPTCLLTNSTQITVNNTTGTILPFDTALANASSMWSSGANTKIQIQTAGTYRFSVNLSLLSPSNGVGYVEVGIVKNTFVPFTTFPLVGQQNRPAVASGGHDRLSCNSVDIPCVVGDFFQVYIWQNAGVTQHVESYLYSGVGSPMFSGSWVGP